MVKILGSIIRLNTTNYEEFYYSNNDINDFARVFQMGRRQVFFYDDFLGRTALEEGEKNFDARIVAFIRACQREKDKLFILTTREYILQKGVAHYSRFKEGKGIEMSKCIVDISKYSRFIRAQILCNHLAANEIPQKYINEIIKDKNYLKIINHPHFNPRIIETFISNGTHERCKPEEYFKIILGYFDHPDSVWLDAFGRLSIIEQEALLVLNTMGTPVLLDDWKEAYAYFFEKVHKETNYFDDTDWDTAVIVLQDNFVKVEKYDHRILVDFHNPGIIDVLTRYIGSSEKKRRLLLEHSVFVEQIFKGFLEVIRNNECVDNKVVLSTEMKDLFFGAFERIWGKYRSCRILHNLGMPFHRLKTTKVKALLELSKYDEILNMDSSYIEQKVTQQIMTDFDEPYPFSLIDFRNKLNLLNIINVSKTSLNMEDLFNAYKKSLYIGTDCLLFAKLIEKVLPEHVGYIKSEEFCTITAKCLNQELQHRNSIDLKELNSTAHELCQYLPKLKNESIVAEICERYKNEVEMQNKMQNLLNTQMEILIGNFPKDKEYFSYFINPNSESRVIDNLFAAIKERD